MALVATPSGLVIVREYAADILFWRFTLGQ
jgi:hypothetical protein